MTNPLLDFSGLPRFADIRTEHITPALKQLLTDNRAIIDRIRNDKTVPTWQNFVQPMIDANERLSRAWGQVSHLNAVVNNPELRETYNASLPLVTQYYAELAQDQALFEKFKQLHNNAEFENLSRARKKIIENELRDFRLGGAELPPQEKGRFLQIQEELSALSSRFNDNLLDATNRFILHVENADELSGIPADVLQTAREIAEKDGAPGWKFTLHAPSYLPVMQYADNRALRERMYRAYSTRASEIDAPAPTDDSVTSWDNTPLIGRILELRKEEARMLGFKCFAEVSLATKMASTPEQVLDFLGELAAKAKPYAERDLRELGQFATDRLQLEKLESWDLAYVSEKLRLERYAFSEQEVKQYFPETAVLPGMFKLVQNLYGIVIAPPAKTVNVQLWHPDVKFFNISGADGKLIGQFYLDLYARPGKRGGGWMDDAVGRRQVEAGGSGEQGIQTPVAYLNCNFSAPVRLDGQVRPALFTHDEVITLFHEFGHGLHHLLTQVEDLDVSGINGVEWDAVELPSQFMENFCWEWEVVSNMTRHVTNGESIPRALFDKMLAAKNFQSGLQMLRQLEFSLFDMRLHFDFDPGGGKTAQQLLDEIRKQIAVIIPPEFNRFPNSFSHVFGGGYAAGYYSYKWAEVLSADAYSLFEETGGDEVINDETGARFRNEILSVGGSRPALESFVAFRGREPRIDALLRHNGMAA
ncbi:oligopeptidase A Metallo peptidase. MEROPS family M03A [Nitrosospira sp. Nl5]|uniref:M3 family metallopeptidase n=1 Tax=Nitrosospira sp. Nl5 TaxID=200120 RepID=UPI00088A5E57|nr:M3 family metallopeptidase [Nitrosospira sp. Nl5]SCY18515.1 oligopeptidase A Metallo peptidase. MEROPS family M03A [Nitrosospira sp. Nl5]